MSAVEIKRSADSGLNIDWARVVSTVLLSRALDELEETRLLAARKVLYQFTARGHDVTQVLLAHF